MNIIFSLVLKLMTVAILWGVYFCAPKEYKTVTVKRWLSILSFVAIMVIIWSSIITYGPRNQLTPSSIPSPPDKPIIIKGNDIFDSSNKWESLDERIKNNEQRQLKDMIKERH